MSSRSSHFASSSSSSSANSGGGGGSASHSVDEFPDTLKCDPDEPALVSPFTKSQHPFRNHPIDETSYYIDKDSIHMVLQIPMSYFSNSAICFQQYLPGAEEAMNMLGTLLMMHCNMAFTAYRRSQLIIPKCKNKKDKKGKQNLNTTAEQEEAMQEAIENQDNRRAGGGGEGDGSNGSAADLPPEPGTYSVVGVYEEVYGKEEDAGNGNNNNDDEDSDEELDEYDKEYEEKKMEIEANAENVWDDEDAEGDEKHHQQQHARDNKKNDKKKSNKQRNPVALRIHFFYNTRRTYIHKFFYEQLQSFETMLMELENTKGSAHRVLEALKSTKKVSFEKYWRCLSGYMGRVIDPPMKNKSSEHPDRHPLCDYLVSSLHPFNTFTIHHACKLAKQYKADDLYSDMRNYRNPDTAEYTFPDPDHTYLLDSNDLNPYRLTRLAWPCRRHRLGIVNPVADPSIISLAHFHMGPALTASARARMTDEEKKAYDSKEELVFRRCAVHQKNVAFTSDEQLQAYMDKELKLEEEIHAQKVKEIQYTPWEEKGENGAQLYDDAIQKEWARYCKAVDIKRQEGMEYFLPLWTASSTKDPATRAQIKWYDDFLAGSRSGLVLKPRLNFSLDMPKQTKNLSWVGDSKVIKMALLDTGYNVIESSAYIVFLFMAALTVGNDDEPLKCNTVFTSLPDRGKSFLQKVFAMLLIPGSYLLLDKSSNKALMTSEHFFNYMVMLVDEYSPSNLQGNNSTSGNHHNNSSSNNSNPNQSEYTEMIKTILTRGSYTFYKKEQNIETGKWDNVAYETVITAMWVFLSNHPQSYFLDAFVDRCYFQPVFDQERFSTEQLTTRKTTLETGDKTLENAMDSVAVYFRRTQCLSRLAFRMIKCRLLPKTSSELARRFTGYVMHSISATHQNARKTRCMTRTVDNVALGSAFDNAMYLAFDSPLSRHKHKKWKIQHMRALIPYLTITLDDVVYAIGALSSQHEDEVMKVLVGMIYKRFIEPCNGRFERSRLYNPTHPAPEQHAQSSSSEESEEVALLMQIEKERKEQEAIAAYMNTSQKNQKEALKKKGSKKGASGSDSSEEKKTGQKLWYEEDKEDEEKAAAASCAKGEEDECYYKIYDATRSFNQCAKGSASATFAYNDAPPSTPQAIAGGLVACPPNNTHIIQLRTLGQRLIQEQGTKGCHASDLNSNLLQLANSMTVPSPFPGDSVASYPAFAISTSGLVYIAKKVVHAYQCSSALMERVKDALVLFTRRPMQYLYGKTVEKDPTVFHVINVTREDLDKQPKGITMYNPMYRDSANIGILQDVANATNKASGKPYLDITEAFDRHETIDCPPGYQSYLSYMRYAKRACISTEMLKKWGFDELPIEDYLHTMLMAAVEAEKNLKIQHHRSQENKAVDDFDESLACKTLRSYPADFQKAKPSSRSAASKAQTAISVIQRDSRKTGMKNAVTTSLRRMKSGIELTEESLQKEMQNKTFSFIVQNDMRRKRKIQSTMPVLEPADEMDDDATAAEREEKYNTSSSKSSEFSEEELSLTLPFAGQTSQNEYNKQLSISQNTDASTEHRIITDANDNARMMD